jgi:hypothetical protein
VEEPSSSSSTSNVYNPSKELYQSRSTPDQLVQGQQHQPPRDVYSPSQDVQDLYKPPAALQRPPTQGSGDDSYNPRQELAGFGGQSGPYEGNYEQQQQQRGFYQDDQRQEQSAMMARGDPRANRRDPRRRD